MGAFKSYDLTEEEIKTRFTHHPPRNEGEVKAYESIRAEVRLLAEKIVLDTPDSRERYLAITHLEEVVFWVNAAIARRGGPET